MAEHYWRRFDRTHQRGSLYLDTNDFCVYYMDKTNGSRYEKGPNQDISNLKIDPAKETSLQRKYGWKEKAIKQCALDMSSYLLNQRTLTPDNSVLVPIPSSKPRGYEGFDDRMTRVCMQIQQITRIKCVDCLSTKKYLGSMHFNTLDRSIERLAQNTSVDIAMIPDGIDYIILVDDQLTKGTHFKAMQSLFAPMGYICIGIFWAREYYAGEHGAW